MAKRRPKTATDLFDRIDTLAHNLWWTWNHRAQRLFAALDPVLWMTTSHNPIETLQQLSPQRRQVLAADAEFAAELSACERELREYMRHKTWFQRTARGKDQRLRVAYFCAEFALHESIPFYSGGLGVLAGDHLKSASDLGIPLVAVGLAYRCGYYEQQFERDGRTRVLYPEHNFDHLPLTNTRERIRVPLAGRKVWARIWQAQVGRVPLYLLDTDLSANRPKDRQITRHLYGGDQETRIQQEIILGIGGVLALRKLGIKPTVFHLNEGHAAFCALERLRELRGSGRSLEKAKETVRASTVFTTHTPVPAGHDRFEPKLMTRYLGELPTSLGMAKADFLDLGREEPGHARSPFCMTVLALNLAEHCNGVAKRHGEVSREMWMDVYGAKRPQDVPIGHVTNGIHSQTWLAPEMTPLYTRYLKPNWLAAAPDFDPWKHAGKIPAEELWHTRTLLRRRLIQFIRSRLLWQIERELGPLDDLRAVYDTFDDDALTIGFARRFATYKRAPLIFNNARRLAEILNSEKRPVQLVFAGKAHPRDADGQAFAQLIYREARAAGLRGRVALVEGYDMHVGRMLTGGCDVWLNNPLPPQEASGTSGMKPPLHGGLNCSVLDGWWPEGYNRRNGWVIPSSDSKSAKQRDREDAAAIYDLIEKEIAPRFYQRDRRGIPRQWVKLMVNSMQSVCGQFSTHRMVGDYVRQYYLPAHG